MKQLRAMFSRSTYTTKQKTTTSPTVSATIVANKQASSNSGNDVSNATEALAAPSQQDLEAKLLLNKDRKQRETENNQNGLVFYQKLEEERDREKKNKKGETTETREQRLARLEKEALDFVATEASNQNIPTQGTTQNNSAKTQDTSFVKSVTFVSFGTTPTISKSIIDETNTTVDHLTGNLVTKKELSELEDQRKKEAEAKAAEAVAKAERVRLAKEAEVGAERVRQEAEAKVAAEAEAERVRQEAEAKVVAEAEAERVRQEAEAKAAAEATERAKREEEKAKELADAKAEAERVRQEEERALAEAEDRVKKEADAKALAEAEAERSRLEANNLIGDTPKDDENDEQKKEKHINNLFSAILDNINVTDENLKNEIIAELWDDFTSCQDYIPVDTNNTPGSIQPNSNPPPLPLEKYTAKLAPKTYYGVGIQTKLVQEENQNSFLQINQFYDDSGFKSALESKDPPIKTTDKNIRITEIYCELDGKEDFYTIDKIFEKCNMNEMDFNLKLCDIFRNPKEKDLKLKFSTSEGSKEDQELIIQKSVFTKGAVENSSYKNIKTVISDSKIKLKIQSDETPATNPCRPGVVSGAAFLLG